MYFSLRERKGRSFYCIVLSFVLRSSSENLESLWSLYSTCAHELNTVKLLSDKRGFSMIFGTVQCNV
jgi:hypothetical protein